MYNLIEFHHFNNFNVFSTFFFSDYSPQGVMGGLVRKMKQDEYGGTYVQIGINFGENGMKNVWKLLETGRKLGMDQEANFIYQQSFTIMEDYS